MGIVGLGPRGVNLLERLLANITVTSGTIKLHLHIIEPGSLGCGIHPMDQPPSLLVNTVASQITMYTDESVVGAGPALSGPSLYSWAYAEGYKYNEESQQYGKFIGREIQPNDYLTRSIFGQYLHSTANSILVQLKQHCEITVYSQEAVRIRKLSEQQFGIQLCDQTIVPANYVFLTTGHSINALTKTEQYTLKRISELAHVNPDLSFVANPYPVVKVANSVHSNMSIAIEGFGLTATDIISELTTGKGGVFEKIDKKHFRYIPSGREPKKIVVYSKSGLPFTGRATNQKGISGQYKPILFTLEAIQNLLEEKGIGPKKQLDFETHVLPLLLLEMRYCYVTTLLKNRIDNEIIIRQFSNQWLSNRTNCNKLDQLEYKTFGHASGFNWQEMMDPTLGQVFTSESSYRVWLLNYLTQDIEASFEGNVTNPFKAACDVLRDVRDIIRAIIDFSGLTPESHAAFMKTYMPVMNRIAVGPPKERIVELLALIEIGIVDVFVGRSPDLILDEKIGKFCIQGKNINGNTPRIVDQVIKARLASTSPTQDVSPLMQNALKDGLLRPFWNGNYHPGGIDIDRQFHPINRMGLSEKRIYALGTIAEGPKFYTYIVPRSGVNSTALVDAGKLVLDLLDAIKKEEKQRGHFSFFHKNTVTTHTTLGENMNRFSNLLNRLKYPIIQAPMAGGIVSPAMIAAITKAGGLGSLPLGYLDAKTTEDIIKKTVAVTSGPFSVNVFVPSPSKSMSNHRITQILTHVNGYRKKLRLNDLKEIPPLIESSPEELIRIAVRYGVCAVSFTFGTLSLETINYLHQNNVAVMGTATTVNEGLLLQERGCDAVIAQGYEAGGHRGGGYIENEPGGEISTMALIPQMVDALDIPVIAAGGIMDGRGITAALALGAKAVQMGTAFLGCKESLASDLHKQTLINSQSNSTCVTSAFTGKQARGIKNEYVIETENNFSNEELLPYPIQHQVTKEFRAKANQLGEAQWASFWSGQAHRMSRSLTVAELMEKLDQEIQEVTIKSKL